MSGGQEKIFSILGPKLSESNAHQYYWDKIIQIRVEQTDYLGHQYPGQPSPRKLDLKPKRMKLSVDFDDEWKKIGSKRQKFEDLGLPLPKATNKHKIIFVKEAEKE